MDGPAKKDAYYQLLAGVALERAGDLRAIERYQLAVSLDPELLPAQVMLARAVILEGDRLKGLEHVRHIRSKWQNRAEASALSALAWARDPARGPAPLEAEQTKAHKDELPVALRAVPSAVEALQSMEKNAILDAKAAVVRALTAATTPGVATWLGLLALQMGDDALARRAALQAVSFSAIYPQARVLAARVALAGGRLDEALNAVSELDASVPDVAIVRASVAYERLDPEGVALALETLPAELRTRPEMAALVKAADVVRGNAVLDSAALRALAAPDVAWGDVIAIDAALDTGNLTVANELIDRFRDAKDRPAARSARRPAPALHRTGRRRRRSVEPGGGDADRANGGRTRPRAPCHQQGRRGARLRGQERAGARPHGFVGALLHRRRRPPSRRIARQGRFARAAPARFAPALARGDVARHGRSRRQEAGPVYVKNLARSFPEEPRRLIASQAFRRVDTARRADTAARGTTLAR